MKIGIFGGSFNPPHLFHKKIVDYVLDNKYVDKVIIVPTGDSYQKRNLETFTNRLNMLKIMFCNDKKVEISSLGNEGYEYTYQYMDYYQSIYDNSELFFICGEDNIKNVEAWNNAKHLIETYKFLVVSRNKLNVENKDYIIRLKLDENSISSSEIRDKFSKKEDFSKYLDKKVIDYIKDYNLYNFKEYKSEKEFLDNYNPSNYPSFAVATDILVFGVSTTDDEDYRKLDSKKMSILLVKRSDYPFKGKWCLPGGFVQIDEDLENAPKRILKNETGLDNIYLEQLYTFGGVDRDPRMRVITSSYMSLIDKDKIPQLLKNESSWFDIEEIVYEKERVKVTLSNEKESISFSLRRKLVDDTTERYSYSILENNELSFDNPLVIMTGIERLKNKISYTDIVFNMMPKLFTLGELQRVYEVILGKKLLDPAFRRIIKNKVIETDKYKTGEGHRPSKLFKYKK